MTLDSFNAFTVTVTPQSALWKYIYTINKKVSEYDEEIPQSQTADNPRAPRGSNKMCFYKRKKEFSIRSLHIMGHILYLVALTNDFNKTSKETHFAKTLTPAVPLEWLLTSLGLSRC